MCRITGDSKKVVPNDVHSLAGCKHADWTAGSNQFVVERRLPRDS